MTTDPNLPGPLDRATALAVLAQADALLAAGEPEAAANHYRRVIGFDDPAVTAGAYYGLGNALFRMDREDDALWAWQQVLAMVETPSTYSAWRQIAAARVRDGDLAGAIKAYREADRRAPAADKPEIASRLGWLAKETGDTRGAARQFRRSRSGTQPTLTWAIIAVTAIVSFTAWAGVTYGRNGSIADFGPLYPVLALTKDGIAAGELWRLVTVTLVHAPDQLQFFLHLGSNMYALYLVGPAVQAIYGWQRMLLMYVLCAITGSASSFVFGPDAIAVGASGAIFGLFGVLLVASRVHHPVLARRERQIMSQVGMIILLNLAIGFGLGRIVGIDNAAHVGGLVGGLWLGLIVLPSDAPTLASGWQSPDSRRAGWRPTAVLQIAGVVVLMAVVAIGIVVGDDAVRRGAAGPPRSPVAVSVAGRH